MAMMLCHKNCLFRREQLDSASFGAFAGLHPQRNPRPNNNIYLICGSTLVDTFSRQSLRTEIFEIFQYT